MKTQTERTFVGAALLTLAVVSFIIPVNYVDLTSVWDAVNIGAVAFGLVLATIALARAGSRTFLRLIPPILILSGIAALVGGDPVSSLFFFAPLLIGAGAAVSLPSGALRRLVLGLLILIALTLLLDASTRSTAVSDWFGTPFRPLVDYSGFRARGIIGQPVPAAMLAVALGAVSWVQSSAEPAGTGRRVVRATIIASVLVALFLTGTRSAFLVAVVVVVLMLFRRSSAQKVKAPPLLVVGMFGLIAASLAALPFVGSDVLASRLLSFDELAGSDSTRGRLFSGEIFARWTETCDLPCGLAGSGLRSLQSELAGSTGILGLTTVDNLYMTILWDLGVLGILALVLTGIASARLFFSRASTVTMAAGAAGALAILFSGTTYDALYTKPVLLVFGLVLGMMSTGRDSTEPLEQQRPGVPAQVRRAT